MKDFMKRFESEFKECLASASVEKASVCYSIDLNLQTMQIIVFTESGIITVDAHAADGNGQREISIVGTDCKVYFKERKKISAERILKKVKEILEKNYTVIEKSRFRDKSYWMIDKGVLVINRKQPNFNP
jgi:hypothetical protein